MASVQGTVPCTEKALFEENVISLHNLPCRAVAHADDVHAALHAVASLSIKAIDSLHISHRADGIALYAARSNGQDSSETAPRVCCLIGS